MTNSLRVEPSEAADFGPWECCGAGTRPVWGFVHNPAGTRTAYFVQWAFVVSILSQGKTADDVKKTAWLSAATNTGLLAQKICPRIAWQSHGYALFGDQY